jgi:2-polyprenyl-3-methyl-5-hydroxy-6-metoxy-1,4-benzoquinol methylase
MENIEAIKDYWETYIYDQQENQIDDVEFLISILGKNPKEILEVCCGSGRISIPLAKAGHNITGFDMNDNTLKLLSKKSMGISNLNAYRADALNIETNNDYKESQKQFIKKANMALKQNGYLYFDFELYSEPENVFNNKTERTIFEGYDNKGIYGNGNNINKWSKTHY